MENSVEKIKPMTVPTGYAALGVTYGYDPVSAERTRQVILGPYGQGKTSFLSSIPETIILDVEKGAWGVPNKVNRAFRVPLKNGDELVAMVDKLVADAGKGRLPFKRVAFDTVDQVVEYMAKYLGRTYPKVPLPDIRHFGKDGAGYAVLTDAIWSMVDRLEAAGYAWTIVGHMQEKELNINGSKVTVPRPVVYRSLLQVIGRNCDFFCNVHSEPTLTSTVKTINLPGGGTREIPGVDVKSTQYVLSVETLEGSKGSSGSNKIRGVPDISSKIVLPHYSEGKYGWDVFKEEYVEACKKAMNT